jgi:hypothetical protein
VVEGCLAKGTQLLLLGALRDEQLNKEKILKNKN